MPSFAIIIPCYNEATRLDASAFIAFANQHSNVSLVFVNDGSWDNTLNILKKIKAASTNTFLVSYERNKGKGGAIQEGFRFAIDQSVTHVGYLDADLSTSLNDYYDLLVFTAANFFDFVLASRIQKLDTVIERNFFRHLIGRTIATVIDRKFNLGVYDTQCGAKVFKTEVLREVNQDPFHTKWFFDVELLLRIRQKFTLMNGAEVPLRSWIDKKQSKISWLSIPEVIKDLTTLLKFE